MALLALFGPVIAAPANASASGPPALSVRAAALVEQSTGQTLYGAQQYAQLPIASTTKLMTALITLEHVRLGAVFAAPNYYAPPIDSQIGLVPGERMNVHDLLLALMLPSADDAAEDLAYNVGRGSVARFVGMMNARARQLGLTHTHYSTPIGLDTPGNYSSASDLVKLASYELQHNRFFSHIVDLPSAVLRSGNRVRYVVNRNDLVGRVPWINGVKTGHTSGAGYVLVGSGTRRGMTLVSAVLGTSSIASRDANTLALLDYGFANFHVATPVHAGDVLARPTVRDRPGFRAQVIAGSGFSRVLPNGIRVAIRVVVPHQLTGPLKRHAVVGYAIVYAGRRAIDRIELLLAHRLAAVSVLTIAARFITRPFTLLLVLALLGLAATLIVRRRGHTRALAPSR